MKVEIAKFLMKMMPSRPTYNAKIFNQESFRHPNFKILNGDQKSKTIIEWVNKANQKSFEKPFEQYFPHFPFYKYFRNKIVLDIGCSIGGRSIYFAEKFKIKAMYGIDVDIESINAANIFIQQEKNLNARYEFKCAYAENLPFNENTFDAIISHDTIEHTRNVKRSLEECKRVTKKDGRIFLVFPSYNFPFGGAHIGMITKTPFLEWFFSADILNRALNEIVSEWEEKDQWYKHRSDINFGRWEKVEGGIGINGITYKEFNMLLNKVGFSNVEFIRMPLLEVSFIANQYPILKCFSNMIKPFLLINFLVDYLSHRLIYILTP